VLQALLDPASLLRTNGNGLNILLVRMEDWHRAEARAAGTSMVGMVAELSGALHLAAEASVVPFLVLLCPSSPAGADDRDLEHAERMLAKEFESSPSITIIPSARTMTLYPPARLAYHRAQDDEAAGMPYTPAFYTVLGTMIARAAAALRRPPLKVIVVDGDGTLWSGVCAEDGPMGVGIDEPRLALQRFLLAQKDAGVLLCLCSKNAESDVIEVFRQRPDMLLTLDDFIQTRIDWTPKSEHLRELAAGLSLPLDSFIFLDDNAVECAEVEANAPGTLVLRLPGDAAAIPAFLDHVWAFDRQKTTAEDRRRHASYLENRARDRVRQSLSLEEFLQHLELEVSIAEMSAADMPRVTQLVARTNQFNASPARRSAAEMRTRIVEQGLSWLVVRASDRFGDYGAVGAMAWRLAPDVIEVEAFLLSCRALGKRIEHRMLCHLGQMAASAGRSRVDVSYTPTSRNGIVLKFLQDAGGIELPAPAGVVVQIPAARAAAAGQSVVVDTRADAEAAANATFLPAIPPVVTAPVAGMHAVIRDIAENLRTCEQIIDAQRSDAGHRPVLETGERTLTPTEAQVRVLWSEVLERDRVGVDDDFFELGGNSMAAALLMMRVGETLGVELPVTTMFEYELTVSTLARMIDEHRVLK
jgi:FkbH-like protein